MTAELANEQGLKIDMQEFDELFKKGYERIAIKNVQDVYTQEIGYEPSFYEVDVAGGTREIFE